VPLCKRVTRAPGNDFSIARQLIGDFLWGGRGRTLTQKTCKNARFFRQAVMLQESSSRLFLTRESKRERERGGGITLSFKVNQSSEHSYDRHLDAVAHVSLLSPRNRATAFHSYQSVNAKNERVLLNSRTAWHRRR